MTEQDKDKLREALTALVNHLEQTHNMIKGPENNPQILIGYDALCLLDGIQVTTKEE